MGKQWKLCQTLFFGGSKITADGNGSHEIKRRLLLGRKVMTNLGSVLKSRDTTLPTEVHLVKAMVFPVVMYGCESWTVKKAERQRMDAFELWCWRRLLRVPWTARRSKQSILKEIQSWVFIGRTDAEAETPILWPPHAKSWLIGKDSDAGRDLGQEEKGATEDEMAGWHHRLNAHESEWTPGVGDGQGGLACCDSWGLKESDASEWLNWTEKDKRGDCTFNFCTFSSFRLFNLQITMVYVYDFWFPTKFSRFSFFFEHAYNSYFTVYVWLFHIWRFCESVSIVSAVFLSFIFSCKLGMPDCML